MVSPRHYTMANQGAPTCMSDLDDHCLSQIFSFLDPLPDLFNVACASRRFSDITTYGNMSLLVSARVFRASQRVSSTSGQTCRSVHPTLEDAIAASRLWCGCGLFLASGSRPARIYFFSTAWDPWPGDTILLEAGEVHHVAGCIIPWPLHIVGAGKGPEDTRLVAARGSPGLLYQASGKLANLTVQSRRAPCVLHQRGHLTVEGCLLECDAEGLDHLFSPLVTVACSLFPRSPATGAGPRTGCRLWSGLVADSSQAGVLLVVETKIKGSRGSRAVHAAGSGTLRSVRVINLSRECLYWFEVDSAVRETMPSTSRDTSHHVGPHAPPTSAHHVGPHAPPTPAQAALAPIQRPAASPCGPAEPSGPHTPPGSGLFRDPHHDTKQDAGEWVDSQGPGIVKREDTGVLLRAKQWRAGSSSEARGDGFIAEGPVGGNSAKRMRTQM